MAENKLSVYGGEKQKNLSREETRARDSYLSPAVDIYETEDGLVLLADLPGVEKSALEIEVDQGVLTIEAKPSRVQTGDEASREFVLRDFYRQFRLPDTIDPSTSSAVLRNGVLTLKLSRAAAAKPRRIDVTVH